MKKALFLAVGAAMALVSCVSEEPVEVNKGRAIDFRVSTSSRATEITSGTIDNIKVVAITGTEVYFNDIFKRGADDYFVSTTVDGNGNSTVYNWPGNDNVDFYGVWPNDVAGVTINNTTKEIAGFKPADEFASQVDLVTAFVSGNKKANEGLGVKLNFKHRLSQIQVQAKSETKLDYKFTISGVRIGYVGTNATLAIGDKKEDCTWGTTRENKTYTYEFINPIELTNDGAIANLMAECGNAMLVPQALTPWKPATTRDVVKAGSTDKTDPARYDGAYIAVKLTMTQTVNGKEFQIYPFKNDEGEDVSLWAAVPIDTQWNPGYKYVYTLNFTNGAGWVDPEDPHGGDPILAPIAVTVGVDEWETPKPEDNFNGDVDMEPKETTTPTTPETPETPETPAN